MSAYRLSACLTALLLGLMSGFFFAFAIDVAPAMSHLDAGRYIEAQQWINRVVRNVGFGAVYFGAVVMPFASAGLALRTSRHGLALAWASLALAYAVAVFWVTRSINVPINDAVAAWKPFAPPADWAALRDRWNEANLWRAVASSACFIGAIVMLSWPRAERGA